MRILVADDDSTILEGYLYFFTRRGHKVIIAESAEELLAKFAASPFDVVITDNSMGGKKTGLDALREIRAGGSKIPVAVVSGDYIQEHVEELGGTVFYQARPYERTPSKAHRSTFSSATTLIVVAFFLY